MSTDNIHTDNTNTMQGNFNDSAHRSQQALQDAMDVLKKYGSKTSDYFSEQATRGAELLDEYRTFESSEEGGGSESWSSKLSQLNDAARDIMTQIKERAEGTDEEHHVSDSFKEAWEKVNSSSSAVFSQVSKRLQSEGMEGTGRTESNEGERREREIPIEWSGSSSGGLREGDRDRADLGPGPSGIVPTTGGSASWDKTHDDISTLPLGPGGRPQHGHGSGAKDLGQAHELWLDYARRIRFALEGAVDVLNRDLKEFGPETSTFFAEQASEGDELIELYRNYDPESGRENLRNLNNRANAFLSHIKDKTVVSDTDSSRHSTCLACHMALPEDFSRAWEKVSHRALEVIHEVNSLLADLPQGEKARRK